MIIIKFISLVVAIWFTVINGYFIKLKEGIPASNFLVQAISIATFVFLQFNMFG